MSIKRICENCAHWDAANITDTETAECRRRPPVIVAHRIEVQEFERRSEFLYDASAFPVTSAQDWCGEFQEFDTHERE